MNTILAAAPAAVGVPIALVFGVALAARVKYSRNGDLASAVLGFMFAWVVLTVYATQARELLHGIGRALSGA
jgi:hypothetical protein